MSIFNYKKDNIKDDSYDYNNLKKRNFSFKNTFEKSLGFFIVVVALLLIAFILFNYKNVFGVIAKFFEILSPLFYGLGIAYLLNPMVKSVENILKKSIFKKIKNDNNKNALARGASVLFSMIIVVLMLFFLLNMLLPELYKSILGLINMLPKQMVTLENKLEMLDEKNIIISALKDLTEKGEEYIQKWLTTDLTTKITKYMSYFTNGLFNFLSVIFDIIIGFIIAIYILFSKEKFIGQSKKLVYALVKSDKANFILSITRKSNEIFGGFIIGKIIDSIIIGIICFLGMSIFRISAHYTLIVSVIVGITNIIPVFGPYIGAIPSIILILIENPIHGLYFGIFILVLQQVDGNVIGPKILGNSTGLSAFWVIIAILLGSGLFGFVGMLLGVPLFAVIYYIIKMIIDEKLKKKEMPVNAKDYILIQRIDEEKREIYITKDIDDLFYDAKEEKVEEK